LIISVCNLTNFDANPASFAYIIAGVQKKSSVFAEYIAEFVVETLFFCNLSIIFEKLCMLFLLPFFCIK